ncbi:MAG TPA: hypothetical protein VE978_13105 [Chitinophagales bacterium]|nr:hypothetical protein [Chitinophagales bacterium]
MLNILMPKAFHVYSKQEQNAHDAGGIEPFGTSDNKCVMPSASFHL